jgi:hypothetical protein
MRGASFTVIFDLTVSDNNGIEPEKASLQGRRETDPHGGQRLPYKITNVIIQSRFRIQDPGNVKFGDKTGEGNHSSFENASFRTWFEKMKIIGHFLLFCW